MKRCPECRRDYYDDTLLYCLDDGNSLIDGKGYWRSRMNKPGVEEKEILAAYDSDKVINRSKRTHRAERVEIDE